MAALDVTAPPYCAAGDGTSDDTLAFTNWVNDLNTAAAGPAGSAEGYVPQGRYTINKEWPVIRSSNVAITVSPGAILDFSGAGGSPKLIVAEGTQGEEVALIATAEEGDTSLAVSPGDEDGFAGSYLLLRSGDVFDPGRTDTTFGEQGLCTTTSSGTIELWTPLALGPYSTSPVVSPVNHNAGFRFRGGTIIGSGAGRDQQGIFLDMCRDARIEDVTVRNCDAVGIAALDSIQVIVRGCIVHDSADPNTGYGVEWINTATDCLVSDSYFKNCRHAVTNGATSSRHGVAMRCGARHCTLWGSASTGDGFDTHACALDIFYEYCKIYGSSGQGINIECPRARVTGCEVWRSAENGIAFHNESGRPTDYQCSGNKVYCALGGSNGSGIQYAAAATPGAGQRIRQVLIANNVVNGSAGFAIGAYANQSYRTNNIVISANIVTAAGSHGIEAEYIDGAVIVGNVVRGLGASVYAIKLYSCTEATVSANTIQAGDSSTGIYVESGSTGVIVHANTISGSATGIHIDDSSRSCTVNGNDSSRCATPINLGAGDGHVVVGNQDGSAS